jgi:hypothetical protein
MMHDYENQQLVPLKRREMVERAERYQLMQTARAGRRPVIARFYHAALAQVGHWMVVSGQHLQRRYGQISELSQPPQKRIPVMKAK